MMYCATVLYPNNDQAVFDFEFYSGTLAPEYASFLGSNCVKFEVRKGLVTPGEPRARFICIASYWIESREKYGVSLGEPGMQELMKKFSSFTDIEPIRQLDAVVG